MIPINRIKQMDGFVKDELVRYANSNYPWRIKAFEQGHVAWIAETYGTRYVAGGRVAHVLQVPTAHLEKIEQVLGRIK